MTNVTSLNQDARPHSKALCDAIFSAIDEIATNNMTHYEIMGVLDVVSKTYYEDNLGGDID